MNSLVPKKITDKNGKQTTVYVRDDHAHTSTTARPSVAPDASVVSSSSFDHKLEHFTPSEDELEVYTTLRDLPYLEEREFAFIDALPSGGKIVITFEGGAGTNDIYALPSLERANGERIAPFETGSKLSTVTSQEGNSYQGGWFTPSYIEHDEYGDGEPASFTDQEWLELRDMYETFQQGTRDSSLADYPAETQDTAAKIVILESRKHGGIRAR